MAQYAVFFNGKEADVQADSLLAAKRAAVALLGVRKSQERMVSVVLVARDDGTPVQVQAAGL